jgi:hypothetical protein
MKAVHPFSVDRLIQSAMAVPAENRLMALMRLHIGQENNVAWLQRVVDDAFAGIPFASDVTDDIIKKSGDIEEEQIHWVEVVLEALKAKGVQLGSIKCRLGMGRVEFLGHVVSQHGLEPL